MWINLIIVGPIDSAGDEKHHCCPARPGGLQSIWGCTSKQTNNGTDISFYRQLWSCKHDRHPSAVDGWHGLWCTLTKTKIETFDLDGKRSFEPAPVWNNGRYVKISRSYVTNSGNTLLWTTKPASDIYRRTAETTGGIGKKSKGTGKEGRGA